MIVDVVSIEQAFASIRLEDICCFLCIARYGFRNW